MEPGFSPRGEGLVERRVLLAPAQVAWLRYVLEAHEGLAFMHADAEGRVWLLAPSALASQLDELIDDLLREGSLEARLS